MTREPLPEGCQLLSYDELFELWWDGSWVWYRGEHTGRNNGGFGPIEYWRNYISLHENETLTDFGKEML